MVMVPRNSTAEGFAYIRQSKRVMIAIKTERTQIHFLSDVLVAVVSLDLKVSNGSLRRRRNLIAVSNVCEAAQRFLFDAPNGLDESVIGRAFGFPFNPDQSRRVLNPGTQAAPWRTVTEERKNGDGNGNDKHQEPCLLVRYFTVLYVKFVFCWMWRTMKWVTTRRRCDQSCFRCRRRCYCLSSSNHIHWDHSNRKQNQNKTSNKTSQ